jgi:hypothetical protein
MNESCQTAKVALPSRRVISLPCIRQSPYRPNSGDMENPQLFVVN